MLFLVQLLVLDTQSYALINPLVRLQMPIVSQSFLFFRVLYVSRTGVLATYFLTFLYFSIVD